MFSEDEDIKLLSVAAEYYKAFPHQGQPESHQLLHYRQHGPSKGEEPRYREASGISGIHPSTSKVDDQLVHYRQHGPSPKEDPRYQEVSIHPLTFNVDDQLIQVANEISLWRSILFNIFLMHFAILNVL